MTDEPMTADDILTVAEAAVILDRSREATRRLMSRGSIRARRVGRPGVWVTSRMEVSRYIAWARTHKPNERRQQNASGRFLRMP